MNLILKRNPVWLECLPTPNAGASLLLFGGDGQQVAVPVPLLLAVSPVVRSILTDHLPPAYSPCCLSLPAITGNVLQVFGDILATGAAAGTHEDKPEEVRQVFQMLGVEAWIVSCHLESIQVGQVLGSDIKQDRDIKQECLDEENCCQLEIIVKIEHKEDNGDDEDVDESKTFDHNQLDLKKKSSPILQKTCIASTHGKIKFPCDLCPRRFLKKSHLLRHVKSVHNKIKFPCDICHQHFSQKDNLMMHVKAVHDKIKIPCNLCSQKFTQKSHLFRHVKSVHNKIEFPCDLCPLKFSLKDSLLRHVKSVHNKIQVSCDLCEQKFTLKSGLKRHMESVHEKKEYSCILCPLKVSQKAHLLRHIKSVHDQVEFPCNLCTQMFTMKSSLKRHINSVHKRRTKLPLNL